MSEILFKMAAKTNVGLERQNNEDNFQVSANLDTVPMQWVNNQQYTLGNRGALMVVADGMGGMNAGEVASQIAIDTVRNCFTPENITDEVVKTRFTIEKFMKDVIISADQRIKDYAKAYPESRGMGTTIVIAWLFDGNLYVSWVGDSRAYIYNQDTGLFQVSKDHSFVQQLVDEGKITEEDAFDYPDSNIITRSLSDATPKVQPECLLSPQKLCDGDIILLCSDGLCGMIRDQETEQIIAQNQTDMTQCVDTLIQAALDAGGADNCTVALCQILAGGAKSNPGRVPQKKNDVKVQGNNGQKTKKGGVQPDNKLQPKWKKLFLPLIALLIACTGLLIILLRPWETKPIEEGDNTKEMKKEISEKEHNDSLALQAFKATIDKDLVRFTICVQNLGDSISATDYQIIIQCNYQEQNVDDLQLVNLTSESTVTLKCSVKSPTEPGKYIYAAIVQTKNHRSDQPLTSTIEVKDTGNNKTDILANVVHQVNGNITLKEYKTNKDKFVKDKERFEWNSGVKYIDLLKKISKDKKNDLELLRQLNQNGIKDTTKTEGNFLTIYFLTRKKEIKP